MGTRRRFEPRSQKWAWAAGYNSASLLDPELPMEPEAGETQSPLTRSSSRTGDGPICTAHEVYLKQGLRVTTQGAMTQFSSCKTQWGFVRLQPEHSKCLTS